MPTQEKPIKHPHGGHRKRLRKRFLHDNGDSMESHELLELLLFTAIPRRNTNDIAHALLNRFGTLSDVLCASIDDLMTVDGVGETCAVFLKSISAAVRHMDLEKQKELPRYFTVPMLLDYIRPLFSQLTFERLYILCFDDSMRLICCEKVSDGSACAVSVNIQAMLKIAISRNATAVILAHNHPNGIAAPSADDLFATSDYKRKFADVGITLMQHFIVVGDDVVQLLDRDADN